MANIFYVYTYGSAIWLAVQAVPLLFTPRLIVSLLAESMHLTTDIEIYLARSLAISLLAIALFMVLFTGSISLSAEASTTDPSEAPPEGAYAVPLIIVSTSLHATSAVYTYVRFTWTGQSVFALAAVAWTALASLGAWCVMFGAEKGHVSKRTGADKRVSGWPFRNVESDRKKSRTRNA